MGWPYHLVNLSSDEIHQRRVLLDRYGVYAQLSALIPILAFQLFRLGVWVYSGRSRSSTSIEYAEVPSSPTLKRHRGSTSGGFVIRWRSFVWWAKGEVAPGWGTYGQWIAAGSWTSWLLFLCFHQVGDDYLHVTKRFGQIAASQFPLHYMLSMKSYASPLGFLLQSSHEELNPWHRTSGRIIYFLLLNHAVWYLNFFVQAGVLYKRLTAPVVIIGIVAIWMLTILTTSSLARVRQWNYRVFFLLHLTIGISLLPLLFFHASHLRYYMVESLAIFIIDIVCRKLNTSTGFATILKVPHTSLIKLNILLPQSKLKKFAAAPGQHIYLSIPPESTPPNTFSPSIHEALYNPFTVAAVSSTEITLILRSLHGPTTRALSHLATLTKARPPLNIEGPYGSSSHFPNLAANYDRILLVAGGVGASFILPIYHHLRSQLEAESKSSEHIKLIWSMRSSAEAAWASSSSSDSPSLSKDSNMQVFFTRGTSAEQHLPEEITPADGSVELRDLQGAQESSGARASNSLEGTRDRPDLHKIVNEVFRHGGEERIAVLVCGPKRMARDLREHVGQWVERGREVFWHDESFGL